MIEIKESSSPKLIAMPQPERSARLTELDTLRGFLLIWMTFTHMPTRVSMYSNQAVGFVSAAEGFIFLAALLTAHIYLRAQRSSGIKAAKRRLLSRVLRIYRYHTATLGVAFTIFAGIAVFLNRPSLQNLLDYYLAYPLKALLQSIPLLYQPPLLDILPMYVLFMLLTPGVMAAGRRRSWKPVLGVSAVIWAGAQFGLRQWAHAGMEQLGIRIPLSESGAFDLFGWQLLWVAGLALGAKGAIGFSASRLPKSLVRTAAVVAVLFFFLRHFHMEQWTGEAVFGVLVDKWSLAILRIVNFAVLGIVLTKLGARLAKLPGMGFFGLIGRSPLEVFSAHILFCLAANAMSFSAEPLYGGIDLVLVLGVTISGLAATAYLAEQRRMNRSRAKRKKDWLLCAATDNSTCV